MGLRRGICYPFLINIDMTKEEVMDFANKNGVKLSLSWWDDEIWLNEIQVPESKRGKGLCGKIINMLKKHADEKQIPIKLLADSCYGTEINTLKSIYAKYGFEPFTIKRSKLTGFMKYDPTKHVDK